ncbi:MAG: AMP-binding protein [Anaerolineales bacterium]
MKTLAQIFFDAVKNSPNKPILTLQLANQKDLTLTNQDLYNEALKYAQCLSVNSIKPNEVVIIVLQHGLDLIAAFWGCILSGAIPSIMPFLTEKLSPEQYRRSLHALFQLIEPAAVVTYADFQPEIIQAIQDTSVRSLIIQEAISNKILDPPLALNGLYRDSDSIALLQHSSGTTGLQKGVALSHQAIIHQLAAYKEAINLSAEDIFISWLPLYHDMGLIAGFLMPILLQNRLVLMSPFDWVKSPARLFQAISDYHGTLTWLPNFAYNFCAQKIRERDLVGIDLSSLRAVINCSEPMKYQSHEMFLNKFRAYGLKPNALATCYAMAENVFAVSQGGIKTSVTLDWIDRNVFINHHVAQPVTDNLYDAICMVSAGEPISNTKVKVLDNNGNELPERLIGEIAIQSNCMLKEYYKRPDITSSSFRNGWYLTGDLGYIANGEIYITGRKKDLIIVGGKNIYPQDIEQIANEIEGVYPGRVVAFGVFNENLGTEDVVLIAESEENDQNRKYEIADIIRVKVNQSSDIVLRDVIIVERGWLLKTSSGKIARLANRDKYLQQFRGN